MNCPHCNKHSPGILPFSRAVDGGLAYAQICPSCGHVIQIRPHTSSDPPINPPDLNPREVARLQFLRWRLQNESTDPSDFPQTAA